jgi:hypothetical protein
MTSPESTSQQVNESTPHRAPFRPKIGSVLASLLLVLGVASLGLTPVRTDHDVFWHLKTGQLIVENGWRLPRTDPFTYGSEGVVWHNHEWLTQLAMHGIYQLGAATLQRVGMPHADAQAGLRAVIFVKTLVLIAAFGIVARTLVSQGVCPILACLVALLAAMASRWTMHARPPVVTYLLLALELAVLTRHWHLRHPVAAALGAVFHFALWSNLHGGWLAGLIVLACWAAGDGARLAWHLLRGDGGVRLVRDDRKLRIHLLLLASAFVGTLINPSGWHLYALTWRVMSAGHLVRLIPEMRPPPLLENLAFFLLLAFAVGAVAARLRRRGIVRAGEAFAMLFFAWQALGHWRHIPLFAIVAAASIGRLLQAALDKLTRHRPSRVAAAAMLVLEFALLTVILFVGPVIWRGHLLWEPYWRRDRLWLTGYGYEPSQYQDAACDFLLVADPPGRLWTNLNIGGFMIWRLSPEHCKVFTDSRFDVHGDENQRIEASINGVGPAGGVPDPDWEKVLSDLGVNVAVLEKATPLVRAMLVSPNWVAVHEWTAPGHPWRDGTMTFIRNTPENAEAITRAQRIAAAMGQNPSVTGMTESPEFHSEN